MSVILKRPNTNATEINFSYNDLKFQITISYLFELELYSTHSNLLIITFFLLQDPFGYLSIWI